MIVKNLKNELDKLLETLIEDYNKNTNLLNVVKLIKEPNSLLEKGEIIGNKEVGLVFALCKFKEEDILKKFAGGRNIDDVMNSIKDKIKEFFYSNYEFIVIGIFVSIVGVGVLSIYYQIRKDFMF